MTSVYYNHAIASDGLTLDTDRGPVDLVAVDRIRHGHAARLTKADRLHLNRVMETGAGETELICEAMGIQLKSLLRRGTRQRRTDGAARP